MSLMCVCFFVLCNRHLFNRIQTPGDTTEEAAGEGPATSNTTVSARPRPDKCTRPDTRQNTGDSGRNSPRSHRKVTDIKTDGTRLRCGTRRPRIALYSHACPRGGHVRHSSAWSHHLGHSHPASVCLPCPLLLLDCVTLLLCVSGNGIIHRAHKAIQGDDCRQRRSSLLRSPWLTPIRNSSESRGHCRRSYFGPRTCGRGITNA